MTRLAALVAKAVGTDTFGLTNYNQLKADTDYLIVAGADLASAATINITSEFHGITGVTTIDNIADALGAVAGQQVRLWIKAGPLAIRNNGGGGNIRTANGGDLKVRANQIVTFVYDGALWREGSKTGLKPLARIASSSATSIANGVYQDLANWSAAYDPLGVAGASFVTLPSGGSFLFTLVASFAAASGGTQRRIEVRKNGVSGSGGTNWQAWAPPTSVVGNKISLAGVQESCVAGDKLFVPVFQDSGAALNASLEQLAIYALDA